MANEEPIVPPAEELDYDDDYDADDWEAWPIPMCACGHDSDAHVDNGNCATCLYVANPLRCKMFAEDNLEWIKLNRAVPTLGSARPSN